ncbi:MAG TPA: hypothetical protein VGI28_01650 [Stellaceae bacterium]|jgi:hypothetical protein
MLLVDPASPLAPGETDTFVFDFTADAGQAEILTAAWTVRMLPYQPGNGYASVTSAPDPAYVTQSRTSNMVQQPGALPGLPPQTLSGQFATAEIGGFPPSAAGSWFIVEATVALSDGRTLEASVQVLCS